MGMPCRLDSAEAVSSRMTVRDMLLIPITFAEGSALGPDYSVLATVFGPCWCCCYPALSGVLPGWCMVALAWRLPVCVAKVNVQAILCCCASAAVVRRVRLFMCI